MSGIPTRPPDLSAESRLSTTPRPPYPYYHYKAFSVSHTWCNKGWGEEKEERPPTFWYLG